MKKVIGILIGVILIGLVVFASTHKYEDSHVRVNGIRVKVNDDTLYVEEMDEKSASSIYRKKEIKVDDKKQVLEFEFKDFNKNGYPKSLVATINKKEFFREDDIDLEKNPNLYKLFLNFKVLDNYIAFIYNDGVDSRSTTLYVIDTNGKVILKEKELDEDEMVIKDYSSVTYEDGNVIKVKGSRLVENTYKGKSLCESKDDFVVEATYTYTLKDGKFTKKTVEEVKAEDYIKNNNIECDEK